MGCRQPATKSHARSPYVCMLQQRARSLVVTLVDVLQRRNGGAAAVLFAKTKSYWIDPSERANLKCTK